MTHCAPGDFIIRKGESITELVFVVSGSLEVVQDGEILAFLGNNDVCGDSHWKENRLGKSVVQVAGLGCSPLIYCCVGEGADLLRYPHHQCGGSAGRAGVPQTFCAGTNNLKPDISVYSRRQTPAAVSLFIEREVGMRDVTHRLRVSVC